jgi:hypothetical protein
MEVDAGRDFELNARQRFPDRGGNGSGIHHASFVCAIFRWSWTIP